MYAYSKREGWKVKSGEPSQEELGFRSQNDVNSIYISCEFKPFSQRNEFLSKW